MTIDEITQRALVLCSTASTQVEKAMRGLLVIVNRASSDRYGVSLEK